MTQSINSAEVVELLTRELCGDQRSTWRAVKVVRIVTDQRGPIILCRHDAFNVDVAVLVPWPTGDFVGVTTDEPLGSLDAWVLEVGDYLNEEFSEQFLTSSSLRLDPSSGLTLIDFPRLLDPEAALALIGEAGLSAEVGENAPAGVFRQSSGDWVVRTAGQPDVTFPLENIAWGELVHRLLGPRRGEL